MLKDINKSGLPGYNITYIKVQFSLAWEKKSKLFSLHCPNSPTFWYIVFDIDSISRKCQGKWP